ncbi:unnamed protein product [Lactuca saligna]|uniref:Uncharacterized protein n=1 Tax=Lactuca saligna TaxID=75948 RepID=A0AA35Y7H9_LACSI|nr:unnamed protein product [Lactuca saligna]
MDNYYHQSKLAVEQPLIDTSTFSSLILHEPPPVSKPFFSLQRRTSPATHLRLVTGALFASQNISTVLEVRTEGEPAVAEELGQNVDQIIVKVDEKE